MILRPITPQIPWPLAPGFPRQLGYGVNQPTELHLGDEVTRLTSLALR